MKKFLFCVVLCCLLKAQAVGSSSLSLHIVNAVWDEKTQLTGSVVYRDREEENISAVLDAFMEGKPQPLKTIEVPWGNIEQIELSLSAYREAPDSEGLAATLLGDVTFEPWNPSLKEVVFVIHHGEIIPKPTYNLSLE